MSVLLVPFRWSAHTKMAPPAPSGTIGCGVWTPGAVQIGRLPFGSTWGQDASATGAVRRIHGRMRQKDRENEMAMAGSRMDHARSGAGGPPGCRQRVESSNGNTRPGQKTIAATAFD